MTGHYSYERVSQTLNKLISTFTVFRSYADAGYLFTIKYNDIKGEAQSGYEFPYSEYSKWLYTPDLKYNEFESDLEDYTAAEIGV